MNAIAKYGLPWISFLPLVYQGKTRDTFQVQWADSNDKRRSPLLIVATDRISTHNVVHESWIKKKGEVLTALIIFWLVDVLTRAGIAHHLIAYGREIYKYLPGKENDYPKNLHHRAIVVKNLDMILVEFIYRAHLCGSLWDKYEKGQDPYGLKIPAGLPLMMYFGAVEKFGRPVFTPTEKSETDPPLPSDEIARKYPEATMLGRMIFDAGRDYLWPKGISCVDSKFEFGIDEDGQTVLADEMLTPDSSRFAWMMEIVQGENPAWLDKQVARDEAERVWAGGIKRPLIFDPPIVSKLTETYLELCELVVRMPLPQFQRERLD